MFSVSDSAISGFNELILLLNIFYFTFNPCEINPIMIQLLSVLSEPINIFANFQKATLRDMLNIKVKIVLLVVVAAKNCSCDDDGENTSDIKGKK